jgi:hypothetical protein
MRIRNRAACFLSALMVATGLGVAAAKAVDDLRSRDAQPRRIAHGGELQTLADRLGYLFRLRQHVSDGSVVLIADRVTGAMLPLKSANYLRMKSVQIRISSGSPRETRRMLADLRDNLADLQRQNLEWIDRAIRQLQQNSRGAQE